MSEITFQYKFKSKIGPLYLVVCNRGLKGLFLKSQNVPNIKLSQRQNEVMAKIIDKSVKQLIRYFEGTQKKFTIPLDISGTEFQKKVWRSLSQIPYGETRSYSDIAKEINRPKAVRAVGSANGKNPFCIIIPCHRVIAADGTLGGYSGGLLLKKKLLTLERTKF